MTEMPEISEEIRIRPMRASEIPIVAQVMAEAFMSDKLYACLVKSDDMRQAFLRRFMAFRLKFGMKKGFVEVTEDLKGVAVWILPGNRMEFVDLILSGGLSALLSLPKESRTLMHRFIHLEEQAKRAVIGQPYWHLSPICVAPECQGRGVGKALLESGFKRILPSGHPCFLETQSSNAKGFYESMGFELLSEQSLELRPDGTIPHMTMVLRGSVKVYTAAEKRRWLRADRNKWAEGAAGIAIGGGLMFFSMSTIDDWGTTGDRTSMVIVFMMLILSAFACIKLYRKGYPEMAVGIGALFLTPILAVVLLFGTCLLIFSGL